MGVQGYREFTALLGKIETELKDSKWLFEATDFVKDEAKRRVKSVTGTLANSINSEVRQTEGGMTGVVYTDNPYSQFVEFGTGPKGNGTYPYDFPLEYNPTGWWVHQSQVPSFKHQDEDNESEFFYITGQAAKPFMYPALKENEQKVVEIATKGINEVLKG